MDLYPARDTRFQDNREQTSATYNDMEVEDEFIEKGREITVISNKSQTSRRPFTPMDPIQRLPLELSTLIIRQSLPSWPHEGSYPRQILEMTTVSQRWRNFLLSTAVLWGDLHVEEWEEDFHATFSAFIHLSSNTPLKLVIGNEPIRDWAGLVSLLLPVHHRITRLEVRGSREDDYILGVVATVTSVINHLGHLPSLLEIYFEKDVVQLNQLLFEFLKPFPSTRLIGYLRVNLGCWQSLTPNRFFDVDEYNNLCTIAPEVTLPGASSDLWVYFSIDDTLIVSIGSGKLQDLRHLANLLTGCRSLESLIHVATPKLHEINLSISFSQANDLIDLLCVLTRLRLLALTIVHAKEATDLHVASRNIESVSLRSFKLYLLGDVVRTTPTIQRLYGLFQAFASLYPSIEEFSFTGYFIPPQFLDSLPSIKVLHLFTPWAKGHSAYNPPEHFITLASLQKIYVGYYHIPSLPYLKAPNLLSLELELGTVDSDFVDLTFRSLHKLVLNVSSERGNRDFLLNLANYPELYELHLRPQSSLVKLQISSLSHLVSITVFSMDLFTNPQGNYLCTALIYHPEHLQSLRELHFNHCVEWDILFLMLERRNFHGKGVKKIDAVALPFVPSTLRQPLDCLLEGNYSERPSLISLSLEGTREVMCDPTIPGCFACLRNMRPGCIEEVTIRNENSSPYDNWRANELYPEDEAPLDIGPGEIRDWLGHRKDLVGIWKSSYEEFLGQYVRPGHCESFPRVFFR